MGDPGDYIGSKISLISRSEIRYEGILHSINNVDSSLTLQNVKSYGTEGRKQIGPQIPPSAEIYDYIMFKGTDIKDIQIDQVRSTAAPDIPLSIPRRFHRSFPPSNRPYTRSRPNLASSADSIVPPSPQSGAPAQRPPQQQAPAPAPAPAPQRQVSDPSEVEPTTKHKQTAHGTHPSWKRGDRAPAALPDPEKPRRTCGA